jgi:hypothetical protein
LERKRSLDKMERMEEMKLPQPNFHLLFPSKSILVIENKNMYPEMNGWG